MNKLITAIKKKDLKKLEALSHKDEGNTLLNTEDNGVTPLNLAIKLNDVDVVTQLLQFRDIDVNFYGASEEPPIHNAVKNINNFPVFKKLLQNLNIDINKKNSKDQYPVSVLFEHLPSTYSDWSSPLAQEVSLKFLELLKFNDLEINYSFKIANFNLPLLFFEVQLGPVNAEAILTKFLSFPNLNAEIENAEGLNVLEFLLFMYLKFHQRMDVIDNRIKFLLTFPAIQKLIRPKTLEIVKAKSSIFNLPYFYLLFKKYNILPQNKQVINILNSVEE